MLCCSDAIKGAVGLFSLEGKLAGAKTRGIKGGKRTNPQGKKGQLQAKKEEIRFKDLSFSVCLSLLPSLLYSDRAETEGGKGRGTRLQRLATDVCALCSPAVVQFSLCCKASAGCHQMQAPWLGSQYLPQLREHQGRDQTKQITVDASLRGGLLLACLFAS